MLACCAFALGAPTLAGELTSIPAEDPPQTSRFDFSDCDAFKNLGKIYKDEGNPFFEEFKLHGRIHFQAASIEGNDVNGRDFNNNYEEVRRFRIGAKAKFLNYFNIKFTPNLVNDRRPRPAGDLDWGYDNLDEAIIGFDIKEAFGISDFDKVFLTYGVQKFDLGYESFESSKKIPTAERTGISNKVYLDGIRPTGFTLEIEKGPWDALLGLFSTEENPEFDAKWDQGLAYQGTLGYQASDDLKFVADFIYNDSGLDQENHWDYHWAGSLRAEYFSSRWGLVTEAIIGDNGNEVQGVTNADRQDHFWAAIVTPTYWLVEDRLEAAFQYQYAGSSGSEGIRTSSRYVRRGHAPGVDVNSGRGDRHHAFYAGLNYIVCDHNSKVMVGIQYDDLNTPQGGVEATTLWFAYRTYF